MPLKVLIVEDEELFADRLEMLVDKLGYTHVGTVDNAIDATAVTKEQGPELVLMDININGEYDGIELAERLQEYGPLPTIFITSLADDRTFARAARSTPHGYLLKPFNELQLQRSIELVARQLVVDEPVNPAPAPSPTTHKEATEELSLDGDFFIKNRSRLEKVSVDEVLYLQADGHYCQVHTAEKKYLVHRPLSDLAARLPAADFFVTHRSYLVNAKRVTAIDLDNMVVQFGGKQAPISKRSREAVLERFDWI